MSVAQEITIDANTTGTITATIADGDVATLKTITASGGVHALSITLTDTSASAADLNAIDALTTVNMNSTAVTDISSSAIADVKTMVTNATSVGIDSNWNVVISDTTLAASDVSAVNTGTSGTIDISAAGTINGTTADLLAIVNNTGATFTTATNYATTLSDTASIADANAILGDTTGTVTATVASDTAANLNSGLTNATATDALTLTTTGTTGTASDLNGLDSKTSVTVDATSVTTITGTSGADTIDLNTMDVSFASSLSVQSGAGNDTLTGTTGNETFEFTNADFSNLDSVDGVSGNDIIAFSDAMTKNDTDFTNISNIDTVLGSTSADSYSLDFTNINNLVFDGNTGSDIVALSGSVDVTGDYSFTGGSNFHNIETLDISSLNLTNADTIGGDGNEIVLNTQDLKNMTDGNNDITINIADNTQGYGVAIYNSTTSSIAVNDLSTTGGDGSGNYTIDSVTLHVV